MKRIFALVLIGLLACQEEINPLTPPNNGGGTTQPPPQPVPGKYANCLSVLSNTTLDVATWNIENFPQNANTIQLLTEMISTMDVDIIAVQEIVSSTNFNILLNNLQEYEGMITSSGQQKLGFIYKPSEIIAIEPISELFTNDNCAFPRPALKTKITHVSGAEVTFLNVHLKCCSDQTASCGLAKDRRRNASVTIKNYIDQNLPTANVIVLGDWNDSISDPSSPFSNLINDPNNYLFADMNIATGSTSNWSYPSWPSHLDHILITNELTDNVDNIRTIKLSDCEGQYSNSVSDHFPVLLRLKNLN